MRRIKLLVFFVGAVLLLGSTALAHDLPLTFIDLRLTAASIDAVIEASARNFAHELPGVEENSLLKVSTAEQQKDALTSLLVTQLKIATGGKTLDLEIQEIEPLPERKDTRLRVHFRGKPIERIEVQCDLFLFDAGHKIFLNIFQDGKLQHQEILGPDGRHLIYLLRGRQNIFAVIKQFFREGVHHIFVGPDHILFIVGLLLLGGTVTQLLRIVTAFTVAHSVTLVLAALNWVSPPARLVEPIIALSIVFVGVHALVWRKGQRDWRLLFAFCFGLIHGFGFANVLREMELPSSALGWSLVSFNIGVELGQACIVLAVAPALSAIHRRSAQWGVRIVTASSIAVVVAGSFWFFQRLFPTS